MDLPKLKSRHGKVILSPCHLHSRQGPAEVCRGSPGLRDWFPLPPPHPSLVPTNGRQQSVQKRLETPVTKSSRAGAIKPQALVLERLLREAKYLHLQGQQDRVHPLLYPKRYIMVLSRNKLQPSYVFGLQQRRDVSMVKNQWWRSDERPGVRCN